MEGNSHDLRPTAACTQSQVAHGNKLYKSVQQLLEAMSIIDFSSRVVEVKKAIHVLKSVTTTYSAASRMLTRHYAETMQQSFMNQERVRRRDCVSDVDEALLDLNQRLVEVGQHQQFLLNFSETSLSAIDLSAFSAAEQICPQLLLSCMGRTKFIKLLFFCKKFMRCSKNYIKFILDDE